MTCKQPKQLGQNFYGRKNYAHRKRLFAYRENGKEEKGRKRELINRILVLCRFGCCECRNLSESYTRSLRTTERHRPPVLLA